MEKNQKELTQSHSRQISYLLAVLFKGAAARNSDKLGNYKMPVKLRET